MFAKITSPLFAKIGLNFSSRLVLSTGSYLQLFIDALIEDNIFSEIGLEPVVNIVYISTRNVFSLISFILVSNHSICLEYNMFFSQKVGQ